MSKLTLDEAIKHCLEVAEQNETRANKVGRQFIGSAMDKRATDCRECAADHRQLAEWLKELKSLRKKTKHLTEWNRKLIDYKNEIICKWGESQEELQEAKRLLKLAVTCLNDGGCTKDCDVCTNLEDCICERHDNSFKWCYTDEVKKLIND